MTNSYDEMLGLMREHGSADNPSTIQLATMASSNSISIDKVVIDKSMLKFIETSTQKLLINPDFTIDTSTGKIIQDNSEYTEPLKKGDSVAVQKISDSLFLVLGKVV